MNDEPVQADKNEHNWEAFVNFARQAGISLEYAEDWTAWWECWKAGFHQAETGHGII
jgi:hypothetical protein